MFNHTPTIWRKLQKYVQVQEPSNPHTPDNLEQEPSNPHTPNNLEQEPSNPHTPNNLEDIENVCKLQEHPYRTNYLEELQK